MRRTVPVLFVLLSPQVFAQDWPQFRGPNRDGASAEKGLIRTFAAEGPKVLWTIRLGEGYGGAAVAGGEVFVLDRKGSTADVLRVLDLETGKEKWSFEYPARGTLAHDGSRSTPTIDDKHVYTVGPFGHVHCISRETHKPVWTKDLLADFGGELPRWGVSQSALLDGEHVILAPQSRTIGLVALSKATGKAVWKTGPLGTMRYVSPILTELAGKRQVILQTQDVVSGTDAATGEVLWKYTGYVCRNSIPSPLPLGDGRILVTGGYDVGSVILRIEAKGGKWAAVETARHNEMGAQIHTPLLYGGHLYALCNTNSADDGLVCFDVDLKVKWQTKKSPHLSNGGMVLTADGIIYSLDGKTGELRIIQPGPEGYKELAKSAPLVSGKELWGPLALSGGRLFIRDHSQMKCVDLRAK